MPARRVGMVATCAAAVAAGHLHVPDSVNLSPQFAPVGMVCAVLTSRQCVVAVSQRVGQHGFGVGLELVHGWSSVIVQQRTGKPRKRGKPLDCQASPTSERRVFLSASSNSNSAKGCLLWYAMILAARLWEGARR